MILGIDWNANAEIVSGWRTPNWYGLLFVSGMMLGYMLVKKFFDNEKHQEKYLDKLLLYVVPATIIGARLGHVFFYDWDSYKNDLWSIFKVWEGGLASHGAAVIILIMLYIYSIREVKKPFVWVLDRSVIAITLAAGFIRIGNLMNHEIVGTPTSLPWGFKFKNIDTDMYIEGENVYRHPTQIYEALCYFAIFYLLYRMYWKAKSYLLPGRIFGVFMVLLWSARFLIEFIKEGQNENDMQMTLNTGQLLSIPLVLIGFYYLFRPISQEKKQSYKLICEIQLI